METIRITIDDVPGPPFVRQPSGRQHGFAHYDMPGLSPIADRWRCPVALQSPKRRKQVWRRPFDLEQQVAQLLVPAVQEIDIVVTGAVPQIEIDPFQHRFMESGEEVGVIEDLEIQQARAGVGPQLQDGGPDRPALRIIR